MNALTPDDELRDIMTRLSRAELAEMAIWHAEQSVIITKQLMQPLADDAPPTLILLPLAKARKRGNRN